MPSAVMPTRPSPTTKSKSDIGTNAHSANGSEQRRGPAMRSGSAWKSAKPLAASSPAPSTSSATHFAMSFHMTYANFRTSASVAGTAASSPEGSTAATAVRHLRPHLPNAPTSRMPRRRPRLRLLPLPPNSVLPLPLLPSAGSAAPCADSHRRMPMRSLSPHHSTNSGYLCVTDDQPSRMQPLQRQASADMARRSQHKNCAWCRFGVQSYAARRCTALRRVRKSGWLKKAVSNCCAAQSRKAVLAVKAANALPCAMLGTSPSPARPHTAESSLQTSAKRASWGRSSCSWEAVGCPRPTVRN
mmetsp:Transcript_138899/g.443498  ORF Transcript_138899/g.443498 Transcript_138899/m.443498 type:complete len:301 (-) Transcript_138899:542-1444(-)